MNANVLPSGIDRLDLAAAGRLWLGSTGLLVRATGRTLLDGLYAITKARLLLVHGSERTARRL